MGWCTDRQEEGSIDEIDDVRADLNRSIMYYR